ncbi:DUF397 domain-containing protein [Candidatus Kaiserbacteria bacterium]|uniref:DUF397 domain-containing protein n=1 Tax=candidate division WWE3 bacterium TaxID=2053526 RepID=A0A955LWD2_UNCKA|nr:DUF397 domain-containing protein [Candidatus Kaiserbacteria bacterium]MCA9397728.1 DUF397 domain-containing protein [candidate division WWE3 bacterium]MCB9812075.1 DUF397 domain-containing protein [Candidatus Nomurabacteria bacterium]
MRNPHEPDGFKTSSITRKGAIKVCVAVKIGDDSVEVRDTKGVNSPTLSFTHPEWEAFIGGVKLGEFDLSAKATKAA